MSIQSQENVNFFQPENVNVTKRESNLKIGVNRITNSKQKTATGATSGTGARSPFVVQQASTAYGGGMTSSSPVNSNVDRPYTNNTASMQDW